MTQKPPADPNHLTSALARLAAAEDRFLAGEFLAPVVRGGKVQVRIAGIVCTLSVEPRDFAGWGIFRPASHSDARIVRPATLGERRQYLELFPLVRVILIDRLEDEWLALPAQRSDSRFQIPGTVPVRLVEDVQRFDMIEARFDGALFWYAAPDSRWDPALGSYLRQELDRLTPPEALHRSGLTAEERTAYALAYRPRYEMSEEARQSRDERRLRTALEHAGAELKDYIERPDAYTVTYEVDGQRHISAVAKNDLSVQMAGICLSGEDGKFDLQSLVGVIREGRDGAGLVRVGNENRGMPEEQYWQIHRQS